MNMADIIIAVTLIALGVVGTVCYFLDLTHPLPTPNAAPAPDASTPSVPVRARTAGPALRVHLCTSCGTHGVAYPGDWCMPCVYRTSPVHRAEEILRDAARKADAS